MRDGHRLRVIESCLNCTLRTESFFCDLSAATMPVFDAISTAMPYPTGVVIFMEGQMAHGIYVLCSGRVKLSTSSGDGKTVIIEVAEPGEVLGLSATISAMPYEVTAVAMETCQVNFVRKDDFLRFLSENGEACLRVAQHLSRTYHTAYEQTRALALYTARENLAQVLLKWCGERGRATEQGIRVTLPLSHEELGQTLGTTRETVSRLLTELKREQIIFLRGSALFVRDKGALEKLVGS
ncbi:MAG: Crp/Fnr family transcriptional regulator [Acidobacteria bacterium]|nr:Crp/Fnr family transcriptional regulator [Acidobacteriota bacterium]